MESIGVKHQNLSLTIKDGKVIVSDDLTAYEGLDLSEWVCVEVLESSNHIKEKRISENVSLESLKNSVFILPEDGIFKYYKYLIPNLEEVLKTTQIPENTVVYYDENFYKSELIISSLYGLENLEKIDISDLYGIVDLGSNNIIYNIYIFISYELLKKKFLEIQELYSEKTFYTSKIKIGDLSYLRNLLLSGILAVKYYIKNNL